MADEKRIILSGFDDESDIAIAIKGREKDKVSEEEKKMRADLDFCMAMEGGLDE